MSCRLLVRLFLAVGAALFISGSPSAAETTKKGDELTREALLKGARVPERREYPLSKTAKPCDDFYKYTCEPVIASFKLPADRSSHTFSMTDASERLLQGKKNFLKALVKQTDKSKLPSPRAGELRDVYTACMDPAANKKDEREEVAKEIKAIRAAKDGKELYALMADRLDEADYGFLGYWTIPNQDGPDFDDLAIMSRLMTLPERTYYDNPAVVKDLEALMTAFFKIVDGSTTTTGKAPSAAQRAKAVLELEKAFAQVHPLPAEMRDRVSSRNPATRAELEKLYPNLQLAGFLGRIPERTQFRNLTPESMSFVNAAMTDKPLSTLQDLALFHSLGNVMDDAYPDYFAKGFAFRKKHLGGPDKRPDRDERCTRMVMHRFEKEIDAELLPILFPDFPEAEFRKMVEKIRTSLIGGLETNSWLSPEAKAVAVKKMRTAKLMVVKPQNDDEWDFNPAADYDPKKPIENDRILNKNKIEKELKELSSARIRTRWLMGPLTVNAYYMPMDNTFVLPIGILQYPLYDPTLPEHVNLAAIGSIVGHELGHGVDDKGAKYDEEGRLKNWMSDKDLAEFTARGEGFVKRFDAVGHNGKFTLGENIGDHVGLTTSYRAAFADGEGPTNEAAAREFFIQYGRVWCQTIRPKFKDMLLKTDPHALGYARVNEQVKQLPGFQSAFSCKEKDAMYLSPKDQLRVW